MMPSNNRGPIRSASAPYIGMVGGIALFLLAVGRFGGLPAELSAQPAKSKPLSPTEIVGEIRFAGSPPTVRTIDRSDEPACENGTAFVETTIVTNGLVANAHVAIESGTMGSHKAPKKPVIVQQTDCLYVPRVQGLMVGQKVLVTNGDPTMHNVHAKRSSETIVNKSQPMSSKPLVLEAGPAGSVIKLGCDVHRWMRAFLPVTDHPFFDVTGRDGSFRISNLPKGKSVVVRVWHEKLGELKKDVKVGERVVFTFTE